jgi:hypothetical protein
MRRSLFVLIVAVFCIVTRSEGQIYPGTDVRGLIETFSASETIKVSMESVSVVLYSLDSTSGKWIEIARTITNRYGYYYFYKVAPGRQVIQVNGTKNYQITVVQINRKTFRFQEVPVIEY